MKPYYEDSHVQIFHGDCRDVLPSIPDKSVDLVLTDPPYLMTANGGGIGKRRKYLADILHNLDAGFNVTLLDSFRNWFVFCSKEQLPDILNHVKSADRWMLITWNKYNPTPLCENTYLPDTEYIIHKFTTGRLFGEYTDKHRYIYHPVEKNSYPHPTVKPLSVIGKLVRLGSLPCETILDPFLGSGTTAVAAKKLGRKCIGIEIEEKYCEIAANRLRQTVMDLPIPEEKIEQGGLI